MHSSRSKKKVLCGNHGSPHVHPSIFPATCLSSSLLVRLSVAWHQRLQCWLDFHEIWYKSSLQKYGATVSHTPLKDVNESLPALSIFI